MSLRTSLLLLAATACATSLSAAVKMPGLFGDHMVLQQDTRIPVWGWADPGEKVAVTLGSASAVTSAGPDGRWRVELPPSGTQTKPQTLRIEGTNTLTYSDVLVGDVWVCSGQSNMEFGIHLVSKNEVLPEEVRLFHVTKSASLTPLDNTTFVPAEVGRDTLSGHWQKTLETGSWSGFSAVGYLFAKELNERTGRPIGMIGAYWGGTGAQSWTDLPFLKKNPALKVYTDEFEKLSDARKATLPFVWADYVRDDMKWDREVWSGPENYAGTHADWQKAVTAAKAAGQPVPPVPTPSRPKPSVPGSVGSPTVLYNGMINPLTSYAIKGAIWYQGEANVYHAQIYDQLLTALITSWRAHWDRGDFPFLFVQLPGFDPDRGSADSLRNNWAVMRESQAKVLALPNTGMATAIDVGAEKNIHPWDKFSVAHRLALVARHRVYGEAVPSSGPVYDHMTVEGDRIRVTFKSVEGGLIISAPPALPGQPPKPVPSALTAFEIAGTDEKWMPATAVIDGNTVIVSSPEVPLPVAVRYAFSNLPECSLYNKAGLPAYPFRTTD